MTLKMAKNKCATGVNKIRLIGVIYIYTYLTLFVAGRVGAHRKCLNSDSEGFESQPKKALERPAALAMKNKHGCFQK